MTEKDSLIEQMREECIYNLSQMKAFKEGWSGRSSYLRSKLPSSGHITPHSIVRLGQYLSAAFQLQGGQNREQGNLSTAGAFWEGLVVWYLNLCLAGTSAICLKGGRLCPQPIKDAFTILHESTKLRSEPDVVIFSSEQLQSHPRVARKSQIADAANEVAEKHFGTFGVINIQCKTNWNDNAQIPMLWNMLYNQARKGATIPNGFTIGTGGYSLKNLGHFGYAFATVPSGKDGTDTFKPTDLKVLRVKSLSAGNYWGHESKQAVCLCISELFAFFNRNSTVFPNVADVGLHAAAAMNGEVKTLFNAEKLLFPV